MQVEREMSGKIVFTGKLQESLLCETSLICQNFCKHLTDKREMIASGEAQTID